MPVSVVISTRNSARTIAACLRSVHAQSSPPQELIVVDNYSTDGTPGIAAELRATVITAGPERSAQRNVGIRAARERFILIVDADMVLEPNVLSACLSVWEEGPCIVAIPEISFGTGFWAACKALERSFYVDDDTTAAARFFERDVLLTVGGYDETLNAGEDWDLSIRAQRLRPLRFADAFIRHDEGALRLHDLMRKKFYYGRSLRAFLKKQGPQARKRLHPLRRSLVAHAGKLFAQPVLGGGVVIMKTCEMAAGLAGMALSATQKVDGSQ